MTEPEPRTESGANRTALALTGGLVELRAGGFGGNDCNGTAAYAVSGLGGNY